MLGRPCLPAFGFLSACAGPVPPLPPAATPTQAGITPITFTRDFAAQCPDRLVVRDRAPAGRRCRSGGRTALRAQAAARRRETAGPPPPRLHRLGRRGVLAGKPCLLGSRATPGPAP